MFLLPVELTEHLLWIYWFGTGIWKFQVKSLERYETFHFYEFVRTASSDIKDSFSLKKSSSKFRYRNSKNPPFQSSPSRASSKLYFNSVITAEFRDEHKTIQVSISLVISTWSQWDFHFHSQFKLVPWQSCSRPSAQNYISTSLCFC